MKTPTNEQIANDWKLWIEYIDPCGVDSQEWFDSTTVDEKLKLINNMFPLN
jgi:hypothetical protein